MSKPKVPSTISDKQMASIQRRARAADKEDLFSKRAVAKRLAGNKQYAKRRWS